MTVSVPVNRRDPWTVWWLLALVLVASAASAWISWKRHVVEDANAAVELCMDYREGMAFARKVGIPKNQYLQDIRQAGIVSVAVDEDTLGTLESEGEATLIRGTDVAEQAALEGHTGIMQAALSQKGFAPSDTLVVPGSPSVAAFLSDRLAARAHGGPTVKIIKSGQNSAFLIGLQVDEARSLNLGVRPATLDSIHQAGLTAVLRISNFVGVSEGWIDTVIPKSHPDSPVSTVIFSGTDVLGYPGLVPAVAHALMCSGTRYGDIEFQQQAGGAELASLLSFGLVRVHSITRGEMDRGISPQTMQDRFVRAVRERNIRILYMRPITKPVDERPLAVVNQAYIEDVAKAVQGAGFRLGSAAPMGQADPGLLLTLIVAAGVAAGCVMLLNAVWDVPFPISAGLVAVGAAGFAALWAMGRPALARQAAALASAIAFPSLAGFVLLRPASDGDDAGKLGSAWARSAISRFLIASALSLAGGLMLAACLTSLVFMVKVKQFIGVKLMHVVPILFLALAYWKYYARRGNESFLASASRLGVSPILVWHAAVIAIIGVAGLIYIARTGNTSTVGVGVSSGEQLMRAALERILPVRPRTKEFLLGHPAFILAAALAVTGDRTLLLPVAVIGLIGQISVANTFAHVHTPIWVSLVRVLLGMGFGVVIGLAGTAVWRILVGIIRRKARSVPR
ncbi:MAG: DUF5693 family protein [Clostridia bacterium]|nr:DUF5693 family protein [Clostridia bacterium]